MIDGSFQGFNPPPHSSPFSQGEFEFSNKPARTPVVLETFNLPIQLIEIKRACDEYTKKGFFSKLFGAPAVVSKMIEFNNQINDRILTLNRNTMKVHSSLEDLACEVELLQKELSENKSQKVSTPEPSGQLQDRISSLEAEQRHLKIMISNAGESSGQSNMIFWAIGITILNIVIAYGIFNSLS